MCELLRETATGDIIVLRVSIYKMYQTVMEEKL